MTRLVIVLGVVVLATGCASWFGDSNGQYDTLEAEAGAQKTFLVDLVDATGVSYETVGTRVNVTPCEPTGGWKVATELVVTSDLMEPAELLNAVVTELESRGLSVELLDTASAPGPDYVADTGLFSEKMTLMWSRQPIPAVSLHQPGGCYSEDRVQSADPHDIEVSDAPILQYRRG